VKVRPEVQRLVELGALVGEREAVEGGDDAQRALERHEKLLLGIPTPVTDAEAVLLLSSFGPDGCFGLAWTLLHKIETAPHSPVRTKPAATANEWVRLLWDRSHR
jgi:hypothetical protein